MNKSTLADHYFVPCCDDHLCLICELGASDHPDEGDLEPDSYDKQLSAKMGREMRYTDLGWSD